MFFGQSVLMLRLLAISAKKLHRFKIVRLLDHFSLATAGLGEFRIRDLNDEINKLLREKRRWEERIVELGGADLGVTMIASPT